MNRPVIPGTSPRRQQGIVRRHRAWHTATRLGARDRIPNCTALTAFQLFIVHQFLPNSEANEMRVAWHKQGPAHLRVRLICHAELSRQDATALNTLGALKIDSGIFSPKALPVLELTTSRTGRLLHRQLGRLGPSESGSPDPRLAGTSRRCRAVLADHPLRKHLHAETVGGGAGRQLSQGD